MIDARNQPRHAMDAHAARARLRRARRAGRGVAAFTLLELMISIGILGVGLIMVAAVFPVALSQHRDAAEVVIARQLVAKAESVLRARLQKETLFVPPPNDTTGAPPPTPGIPPTWPVPVQWFVVPAEILPVGTAGAGSWLGAGATADLRAAAYRYFNRMSGFRTPPVSIVPEQNLPLPLSNTTLISRFDMFAEPPPLDDVNRTPATRYLWYGFYRTGQSPPAATAEGEAVARMPALAVAVCRAGPEEEFVPQSFGQNVIDPNLETSWQDYNTPQVGAGVCRFPLPWRVEVKRLAEPPYAGIEGPLRTLVSPGASTGAGRGIAELAPVGSKLFNADTGQVYTVAKVEDFPGYLYGIPYPYAVEIVEDQSLLPDPPLPATPDTATFHVYVFPPAVNFVGPNVEFTRTSPLIGWFFF